MDGDITFGAWLKSRRRQLDLTQKGLAHQVGCSVGTVRKMEADERRPSRQLAELLAECLEIPSDQHEVFIAFARSEPYISDTPLPVLSVAEDQVPIIPQKTKEKRIRHNLPLEVTQFVGREAELVALDALFKDQEKRLVTILGPGGIGKTRLALDYARHQLDEKDETAPHPYKDGVFVVDLTPLKDNERLVFHLAEALNLRIQVRAREERSPKQQLLDYLQARRLFLILDNYEHLLPALFSSDSQGSPDSAALVGEILGAASGVRILVTSRERLNLQMEQVFVIEGLTYPEIDAQALEVGDEDVAGYTAIQFFLQSAQRSRQDFSLNSSDERRALLQICQLVGGMPLGLELAAAWVDVLSLVDIAAEIQQCLDFLETELRDVPDRHRSMRATFDSSWRKLDEREQSIFSQLSVFRGGFTLEAAQAVTGSTLRQLSRLVNKSLIQFNHQRHRYQVHELLRQYGAERLSGDVELDQGLRDRHSTYYCQKLADYTNDLKGAGQPQAFVAIETDIVNIRLAWHRAIERQDLVGIEIAAESLYHFCWNIGWYMQGKEEFEKAVAMLRTSDPDERQGIILGKMLAFLGQFYTPTEDFKKSSDTFQESLTLLQRLNARDEILFPQLFLASLRRSLEESNRLLRKSLTLAKVTGDQWAIASALFILGCNAYEVDYYDEAEKRWRQALKINKKIGEKAGASWSLVWLSFLAGVCGRYNEALVLAKEAKSMLPELINPTHVYYPLIVAHYNLGAYKDAEEQLQQLNALIRTKGLRPWKPSNFYHPGMIAFKLGDFASAEEYLQADLEEAIEDYDQELVARIHDALGRLNLAQGDFIQAVGHLESSLDTAKPLGRSPLLLAAFATSAELFAEEGNLAYAALLATYIINHPASQARIKERADELLTRLEEQLNPNDMAEIRQRSQESDLDSLAAQLVIDLGKG